MNIEKYTNPTIDLKALENSANLYDYKLKKLNKIWIPLQFHIPYMLIGLLILGTITTLFTKNFWIWAIIAPTVLTFIILDAAIQELSIDLSLIRDEARYLLYAARRSQTNLNHGI
ncbi:MULTISPECIES: hypothetical protein [Pseudomonas]|uniref:hypothetical protein n=1 Tax=Pseudomonas TaxID=286 RepID=UPI003990377C